MLYERGLEDQCYLLVFIQHSRTEKMKLSKYLALVAFCQLPFTTADDSSSALVSVAKQEAASADLQFFVEFLDDFNVNLASYTSFMNEAKMTLPQDVANYYYHLKDVSETTQLLEDLATSFPFTQFKTFITAFPWYSSLLSEASATNFYVPDDFITQQAEAAPASSTYFSAAKATDQPTITASSSKSVNTELAANSSSPVIANVSTTTVTTIQSINVGLKTDKYIPLVTVVILCCLFG
ncbi:unnamed protein product [Kluyveromyces dobzhanskii CBS 2104]|uniref:WGS project CCBQ000000000 data, contig 00107 n=1 Tax=Kluyveromyces dobzhanskii CBS 2104 TaxID=1427455 RepID=A0A0A8L0T3_9SACH|nr:unnamed protein product [Kluyveromyces dobzhanskii CBS 2104]